MTSHHEAKISKILRVILSFVMFISITLFALCVCVKGVFLNKSSIEKMFIGAEYVNGVRSSVCDYVSDIYVRNGIDAGNVDELVGRQQIKDAVRGYVAYNIGSSAGFNEKTYLESVDIICSAVNADLDSSAPKNSEQAIKDIVDSIKRYIINEINISFSAAKNIINIASIASVAGICISLFFAVSSGIILYLLGTMRYRSLRFFAIAFASSGITCLGLALAANIIMNIKRLDIYPIYLYNLAVKYINTCVSSVAIAGSVLLVAALYTVAIVWNIRRKKY